MTNESGVDTIAPPGRHLASKVFCHDRRQKQTAVSKTGCIVLRNGALGSRIIDLLRILMHVSGAI